ncbi:MAG: hypothetical protein P4M01_07035 [Acidobacteriota bacterium]|nr:hypothetical protein [Acidobacteriota bacterium]
MIFSDDAKFCGISFYQRSRRRALVAITYAISVAYVLIVAAAPFRLSNAELVCFSVALLTATNILFASMVRPTLARQQRELQQNDPESFNENDLEPDEYESALPSGSHCMAYKVMAVCFIIGAVPMAVLVDRHARHYAPYGIAAIVLLCILVASLPQAVILWQHPDLAEQK